MLRRLPFLLLALLGAGCASISVLPTASKPEARAPRVLYAAPFSFAGAAVNVDRKGKELADFEAKLSAGMARDIAERAAGIGLEGKQGIPDDIATKPRPAWLVKGRFIRVNQGSRALRAVVGLGTGGTKMEAQVEVYDLSVPGSKPFLTFLTTGGSGAFPGGIFNPTVYTIVFWSATGLPQGVTDDATRTCRMVIATVSQEMGKRGYLPEAQQKEPKALGGGADEAQKLKARSATAPASP